MRRDYIDVSGVIRAGLREWAKETGAHDPYAAAEGSCGCWLCAPSSAVVLHD